MFHFPERIPIFKKIVLLLYTLFLLILLFNRTPGDIETLDWEHMQEYCNFKPFYTIYSFLQYLFHGSASGKRLAIINLIGNVIMFIPLGLLLPDLFSAFRPFSQFFLKCLAMICLVEFFQFLTLRGVMDVDDVLLNMLGFSLGYFLLPRLQRFFRRDKTSQPKTQ